MIAILGIKEDVVNYEAALTRFNIPYFVTQNSEDVLKADALLLPGGGDINPAYYNEEMNGSEPFDEVLDKFQFEGLKIAVDRKIPVMGICRGTQLINAFFGGNLIQDMPLTRDHRHDENGDKYHQTKICEGNFLHDIYGDGCIVNCSHHQCIDRLGDGLKIIQWDDDGTPEAIMHESLPVIGTQWHPERTDEKRSGISTEPLFRYFVSLIK